MAAILTLSFVLPSHGEILISVELDCFGDDVVSFELSPNEVAPDFTVELSPLSFISDFTFQIVDSSEEADLVFADEISYADKLVCKSSTALDVTTIRVVETAIAPDLKITLSESVYNPDYKFFVDSEVFSVEEAAAVFAVMRAQRRQY